MAKKKVIIIGAALGRVGSSAVMGLLNLANVNMGGRKSGLVSASHQNPKGFFEIPSIGQFFKNNFRGYYPEFNPPPVSKLDLLGRRSYKRFKKLIDEEFGSRYPIAMKGGRCLVLPMMHYLRNIYDVRVLMLRRKPNDQAESMLRVWKRTEKKQREMGRVVSKDYIARYLRTWLVFVSRIQKKYNNFKYLDVQFEDVIKNPIQASNEIFKFIGIKPPPDKKITKWIDARLVNKGRGVK
jgi:hypothetical protein